MRKKERFSEYIFIFIRRIAILFLMRKLVIIIYLLIFTVVSLKRKKSELLVLSIYENRAKSKV